METFRVMPDSKIPLFRSPSSITNGKNNKFIFTGFQKPP